MFSNGDSTLSPTSTIDPLTGALNKDGFEMEMLSVIEQGENFSLLIIDIDHFKTINDAFGHLRGDHIISEVAKRLFSSIRKEDVIGRFGGDEFVILLRQTDRKSALSVAQRIVNQVNSTPFGENPPLNLSVSIGMAFFPDEASSAEELFNIADTRLYIAKRTGRNKLVSETPRDGKTPVLGEAERLVERETQLDKIQQFIRRIPDENRSILTIIGSPGSGRTSLLKKTTEFAELQGIRVLNVVGKGLATRTKPLCAISRSVRKFTGHFPENEKEIIEFLSNLSRQNNGILIAIDNYEYVDWASIQLLKKMFSDTDRIFNVAVAYVLDSKLRFRRPFLTIPASEETVFASPLSIEGTKLLLRALLQWEPPDEFVIWLQKQSAGMPALIRRGVEYMLNHGFLKKTEEQSRWEIDLSYTNLNLRDQVGFRNILVPNNLPGNLKNFVGREKELAQLSELLEHERLITIVGIGGIGKTRLSLQVASESMDRFPDGVYFVQLAPLQSHHNILPAIADAVGFTFRSGEASVAPLANYLQHKHILMILDNFEHIKEGAFLVKDLIQKTDNLKLIVTSREPLKIDGEQIFELSGLEVPPEDTRMEKLIDYSSIQLFIQSARKVKPDFSINNENAEDIQTICRMLDGLPLGIELATSWLRVLDVNEIVSEIRNGFHFLQARERDRPERHRSLYAAFDYSWKLLNDQEKLAFSKLSVFHGGFTREAAGYVSGLGLPMLGDLIDRALVEKYQKRRYRVHEALRQFAEAKLRDFKGMYSSTKEKHRRYFMEFVQKLTRDDPGWSHPETSVTFESELGNIMAAWANAMTERDWKTINGLLHGTYMYFLTSSKFPEGIQLFMSTIKALENADDVDSPYLSLLAGKLKIRLGMLYGGISNFKESESLLKSGVEILRKSDDEKELAFALSNLVYTFYMQGKYQEGEALLDETMELAQKHDLKPLIGKLYNTMAIGHYHKGEFDESIKKARKAVEIFESIGYLRDRAAALNTIGSLMVVRSEPESAEKVFKEIISFYTQLGDIKSQAIAYHNLGATYKEARRLDESLINFHRALNLFRSIGEMRGVSVTLNNIGGVLLLQRKPEKAWNYFWGSIEAASHYTGNLWTTASALGNIGQMELDNGDKDSARKHLIKALEIARSFHTMPRLSTTLYQIGLLFEKMGKAEDAYFLMNLVLSTSSMAKGFVEEAKKKREELEEKLPPQKAEKIRQLAKDANWDEVVEKILNGDDKIFEL